MDWGQLAGVGDVNCRLWEHLGESYQRESVIGDRTDDQSYDVRNAIDLPRI